MKKILMFLVAVVVTTGFYSCQKETLTELVGKQSSGENSKTQIQLPLPVAQWRIYAGYYNRYTMNLTNGAMESPLSYTSNIRTLAYRISTSKFYTMLLDNPYNLYIAEPNGTLTLVCTFVYNPTNDGYIREIEFKGSTNDLYVYTGTKIFKCTNLLTGTLSLVNVTVPNADAWNSSMYFSQSGIMYVTVCEPQYIKTYSISTSSCILVGTYNRPSSEWYTQIDDVTAGIVPDSSPNGYKLYVNINNYLYRFATVGMSSRTTVGYNGNTGVPPSDFTVVFQ